MTTTTAPATQPARPTLDGSRGIAFGRLLTVELRKLVDTRSGRWMLVAIAVVSLLVVGLQVRFADHGQSSFENLLGSTFMPQLMLIPVFGVLAMTSEFSQRTAMTTFALEPRRWRVVVAKVVAALVLALAILVVGVVGAALAHLAAIALKGEPAAWTVTGPVAGAIFGSQAISVLQGLAFGLLLRSSALAIVVYFALPTVFTIVTRLVHAFADVAPWLDLGSTKLTLLAGQMKGEDWQHLATSGLVWLVLPLALGTWLLNRREIV